MELNLNKAHHLLFWFINLDKKGFKVKKLRDQSYYDQKWNENFSKLRVSVRINKRIPTQKEWAWPGTQRYLYKRNELSQERIEKLESIPGWFWSK